MTLNGEMALILHYFAESTQRRLHYVPVLYQQTQSRDTMSNFATEQRLPLKLLIYRKVGHKSISYYCNCDYNYIDISRKMNYNRNRQFGRLIGTIISLYVQQHTSRNLAVYQWRNYKFRDHLQLQRLNRASSQRSNFAKVEV